VDENALCKALKSGHLQGAAIDVFEAEPYKGPLQDLGNVILTPHVGSYARESRIQMETDAVKNLIEAIKNSEAKQG
jgi:D-3-phosphoglycerate dehydrogenase